MTDHIVTTNSELSEMGTLVNSDDTSKLTSKILGSIVMFEKRLTKWEKLRTYEGVFPVYFFRMLAP